MARCRDCTGRSGADHRAGTLPGQGSEGKHRRLAREWVSQDLRSGLSLGMVRRHLQICVLLVLGGCVTTPLDGSPQVQTAAQARRADLPNAISAPLRDLNILQSKIPDTLLAAAEAPYGRPPVITCDWLISELLPLNGALGPDLEDARIDDHTLGERASAAVLGAIAGAASDTLPMGSWIREVSGSNRHDKLISAAITAGQIRRGYLKGLGESRGCAPPARPYRP